MTPEQDTEVRHYIKKKGQHGAPWDTPELVAMLRENVDRGPARLASCHPLSQNGAVRNELGTRDDCEDVVPAPFRCMSHLRREEIVKRDMNLALAILKTLEENKSPHLSEFDIENALKDAFNVSNRGVWYQLNLLADANFVRSMGNDWRLTWNGHEFLKSAGPNAFEDT